MPPSENKSIMRSLGEFVGHLWHAAKTDPSKPPGAQRTTVRHEAEESQRDTAAGKVTLRRTTIEEVEVEPNGGGDGASPGNHGAT